MNIHEIADVLRRNGATHAMSYAGPWAIEEWIQSMLETDSAIKSPLFKPYFEWRPGEDEGNIIGRVAVMSHQDLKQKNEPISLWPILQIHTKSNPRQGHVVRSGVSKITEEDMAYGDGPSVELHLTLDLAAEIERSKNPRYIVISRESQTDAMNYFNQNGFEATLDRTIRLREENNARHDQIAQVRDNPCASKRNTSMLRRNPPPDEDAKRRKNIADYNRGEAFVKDLYREGGLGAVLEIDNAICDGYFDWLTYFDARTSRAFRRGVCNGLRTYIDIGEYDFSRMSR